LEYPVDAECDVVEVLEYPSSFFAQAPKLSAATTTAITAKVFIFVSLLSEPVG
jgi:hypothetical protein